MIYDAIVVGSGPGGALAAATLASAGKSVLLVDRQEFPRDKICGDGLPARVMRMLHDLDIDIKKYGLKFQQIAGVCIRAPSGATLQVDEKPSQHFSLTSPRFHFDNMLHDYAVEKGAHFEVMDVEGPLFTGTNGSERVAGIIQRKGKTKIEHEARIVIAADGVSSTIARAVDPRERKPEETAIAIRAYGRLLKPMPPYVFFDFHPSLLPGYAWLFPMGQDEVNIGLGLFDQQMYKKRKLNLKLLLTEFQERIRAEYPIEIDMATVKSWPLPLWFSPESRVKKGVFLVGDAGHFVDALTGGGIFPAMLTGQLAGKHAARVLDNIPAAYDDYDTEWRSHLNKGLNRAILVQKYIGSKPLVFNGIFTLAAIAPALKARLLVSLAGEHL
jgi:geranylgeranyl reductase family protein